jgi:hypothetical protein
LVDGIGLPKETEAERRRSTDDERVSAARANGSCPRRIITQRLLKVTTKARAVTGSDTRHLFNGDSCPLCPQVAPKMSYKKLLVLAILKERRSVVRGLLSEEKLNVDEQ